MGPTGERKSVCVSVVSLKPFEFKYCRNVKFRIHMVHQASVGHYCHSLLYGGDKRYCFSMIRFNFLTLIFPDFPSQQTTGKTSM